MPFGRGGPGTPGMPGSNSRTKRMRTSFKHHQLRTMKSYFAINHNPDAKDLKQLSQKTGLPKRVLQVSRLCTFIYIIFLYIPCVYLYSDDDFPTTVVVFAACMYTSSNPRADDESDIFTIIFTFFLFLNSWKMLTFVYYIYV